ncbi:hypothetical protein BH10ACT11_BH10ACT11_05590 [soil metagenome]
MSSEGASGLEALEVQPLKRAHAYSRRWDEGARSLIALALILTGGLALNLWLGRDQTLIQDEWGFLVERAPWNLGSLLDPHNGHLLALPLLVFKILVSTFGIDSFVPLRTAGLLAVFSVVVLLYVLGRRRLGPWLSLVAPAALVFLGGSYDTVLTSVALPYTMSVAFGLTAMLALDSRRPKSDAIACGALICSVLSFTIGLAFVLAAGARVALARRTGARQASWVAIAPLLIYVAWFVWARHFHETHILLDGVGGLFSGMADNLAAVCAAVTGLGFTPGDADISQRLATRLDWGQVLAVGFIALYWLRSRSDGISGRAWVAAVALVGYLALIALGLGPGRTPNAPRYLFMGVSIAAYALVELGASFRPARATGIAIATVLGLGILAGAVTMKHGGALLRLEAATNRAELGALELGRGVIGPDFFVEDSTQDLRSNPDMLFTAGDYFQFSSNVGTPADSEAELLNEPEQAREAADLLLARALPISITETATPDINNGRPVVPILGDTDQESAGGCVRAVPADDGQAHLIVHVPPGGLAYETEESTVPDISLRRYAVELAVEPAALPGAGTLVVPIDLGHRVWAASITSTSELRACPIGH